MRKKHLRLRPKTSDEKRRMTFLEGLITKYFDQESLNKDSLSSSSRDFNEDEVYKSVIHSIQNKRASSSHRTLLLKIAASIVLVFSIGILFYSNRTRISELVDGMNMIQKEVGKGQVSMVRLEDGTKVWLNAGSKLTYPKRFDNKNRKVTLIGEAYFEVVHLKSKPFIIISGAVKTVVLGTSFNINAYPESRKVEVTVLSGKVAVITPGKWKTNANTVFLTPNQKMIYKDRDVYTPAYSVNADESIGWKEGKLIFKSTPLAQAVKDFGRTYNIILECSDKIRDCKITANFDNDSLGNALKVMTKMIDGTLSFKNGKYYLDGKGCN